MAQNALTVTVANPTPPTNFTNVFVGNTPPLDPAQVQTDDGTAGSLTAFGTNKAATNTAGAPGAGISNAAEGAGTEVTVTATSTNPNPVGQLVTFSDLGSYTNLISGGPNTQHASSLNAAGTSTITSVPAGGVHPSVPTTVSLTITGTNFRRDSIVNIGGVPQITNYVSATQLTVANAQKLTAAGSTPVTVTTGGVTTAPTNWTFT